ncbi:voltage-gated potassium channel [Haloarcula vallismortis]|uniref:Potassium channel-like protein n=2 Tax=Haloarcula vallismortis TaxID=28442 RepID=M0QTC2_HALVA|nr:NAD-binding protein [Haloarcula vallismortis]EMA05573.1 potassium channel-like protein [Haloarcula vallismortis ATCC 29715]SDW85553.1 voltage-gated potassium channel [Haloarcula vallismortis]
MANVPEDPSDRTLEDVFYPADRIPFVEWDELSGAKPTVVLTGGVALLAFVTGLSNLSQASLALNGPLTAVVDLPLAVVRFGGVLFAFILGIVTVGLQRRKRLAWRVAVVVALGLVLLPLATFQPTDIPLLVMTLVTYPLLVRNRHRFDQSLDLSPIQIASLSAIFGVILYGTVGAYGLRGQFLELDSWGDAVYYVVVTIATVGYGDITPVTAEARWFSLSIILFGTGAFTVAVGALIGPAIESRMATAFGVMTASDLTLLEDHVVVLGYGDVTASLLEELGEETAVVVVTPDEETVASLKDEGVNLLTGDPTDEDVLRDARVGTASGVVVGSNDDARDVLAVIATKNVNPDIRTVAAATDQKHVEKFRAVGADEVINPRSIGGRLLGQSVLGRGSTESLLTGIGTDNGDPDNSE